MVFGFWSWVFGLFRRPKTKGPRPKSYLGCHRFGFQLLSLVMCDECVDEGIEVSFHYEIELVNRQADTMVADAVLLEVVRANLFRAIAGADHRATLARLRFVLFLLFDFL